ncbi:unnamed protein product [Rotaria magnacalcarata]
MRRNRIHEEADKLSPQKNKPNRFQLYSFEMIPEYLQSNPYIRTGYRHGLNVKECLFSLLYLNNESVNIWSHLIGTGLFIYFFFRDIYAGHALPYLSSTSDYYFVLFYTFSVITCMLCSTLFHLFGCISSQAFADFLKLDLCGIGLGILGCYLCGLHLSCYILRTWLSLFGFLPGFHWYYLHGGWSNQFVQHFFPKLFVLYLILSVGTIAYLTKFPERFFPGYFDFIFASHQIWHISSLGAFIWWYQNGVDLLQYRLSNPCHTLQN